MIASAAAIDALRPTMSSRAMDMPRENDQESTHSPQELETKRAIQDLLEVLPSDVLDEIKVGSIDFNDTAFLEGLMDHVSRLAMASPKAGQKILPKIIKLKKLISRSLRESDPEVRVSATVTRTSQRVGRNDACPCGSGRKYKQCCLRHK
jgi:uncharacterized protein YecA (UPF0149 family)